MQTYRLVAAVSGFALVVFGGAVALADGHTGRTGPVITPIVTGLDNPRGIALDHGGGLYVSEAGPYLGSDPSHANGDEHGTTTGRVTKWARQWNGAPSLLWSTPFAGVYDNVNGIPEVLGAAGLSAFVDDCHEGRHHERSRCGVFVIVGESQLGVSHQDPTQSVPPDLGHLFRLSSGSGWATDVSDVGDQQYQWTDGHRDLFPPDFPDSNAYGVLVALAGGDRHHENDRESSRRSENGSRLRIFVADAGANTLSEVAADGSTRVIAYIPNDGVRDATPTCVAKGPDGALYVGTLNLVKNDFGNNPGHSDVWRIDPNTDEDYLTAAHLWASALTTVTSCTLDRNGNFWATEMFEPNPQGPPGDLVRIPFHHPTELHRFGGGQLPFPGGIAVYVDGSLYVAINSLTFQPHSGAVVKVKLH